MYNFFLLLQTVEQEAYAKASGYIMEGHYEVEGFY